MYRAIVRRVPIVCVDIVVRSPGGKVLLVKRRNEPLAGHWWVIGGRILHNEDAKTAARRKVLEEAGIAVETLRPIGYYEGMYRHSAFGSNIGYHTLSIVFEAASPEDVRVQLDAQSVDWMWADSVPKGFTVIRFET
jgi:ADP-ribose pyrophosphatase YjhB (NUDIX family)